MENRERQVELTFRQVPYLIETKVQNSTLKISIEEKETGKRWLGDFPVSYIEEITHKTGNYKKFNVFMKMLNTALDNCSESVFVDLLTYQDLEMLKNRKRQGSQLQQSQVNPKILQKRYLILTYAVEFDRVHYPLPLVYDENPSTDNLLRTIERLRSEIMSMKQIMPEEGGVDGLSLLRENEQLKQQIIRLEHAQALGTGPARKGAVEIDTLVNEKKELEEEIQRLQLENSHNMKDLRQANKELTQELDRLKGEMDQIISQLEAENDERMAIKNIKTKVNQLTQELEKVRKSEQKAMQDYEKNQTELDNLRQSDRKQKARIKQLESELEAALKSRGRTPVRYQSPGTRSNSASNRLNARSPGQRLYTPPGSNSSSRNSSRPGSDRSLRSNAQRTTTTRNNPSPNQRRQSPSTRTNNIFQRNRPSPYGRGTNSPGSRLKTPPQRRGSPGQSRPLQRRGPGSRGSNQSSDNESDRRRPRHDNQVKEIDERLSKLQHLLNAAKA